MTVMGVPNLSASSGPRGASRRQENGLEKRYNDFVHQKLYDLLIMAQATAGGPTTGAWHHALRPAGHPGTANQSIHRSKNSMWRSR